MSFCCCFSTSVTPEKPLLSQPPVPEGVLCSAPKAAAAAEKLFSTPRRLPESPKNGRVQPSLAFVSKAGAANAPEEREIEGDAAPSSKLEVSHPSSEGNEGASSKVTAPQNLLNQPLIVSQCNLPKDQEGARRAPPASPAIKPQQSPIKIKKPPLHPEGPSLRGRVYDVTHWVIYSRRGEVSRQYSTRSLKGTGLDLDD